MMTLNEHIKTAKALVKVNRKLSAMYCRKPKGFEKLRKSEIGSIFTVVKLIDRVRCILDEVYFRSVDSKTFDKLGYIYYKVKDDGTKTKS